MRRLTRTIRSIGAKTRMTPGPFGCGSSFPSRKMTRALVLVQDLDRAEQVEDHDRRRRSARGSSTMHHVASSFRRRLGRSALAGCSSRSVAADDVTTTGDPPWHVSARSAPSPSRSRRASPRCPRRPGSIAVSASASSPTMPRWPVTGGVPLRLRRRGVTRNSSDRRQRRARPARSAEADLQLRQRRVDQHHRAKEQADDPADRQQPVARDLDLEDEQHEAEQDEEHAGIADRAAPGKRKTPAAGRCRRRRPAAMAPGLQSSIVRPSVPSVSSR